MEPEGSSLSPCLPHRCDICRYKARVGFKYFNERNPKSKLIKVKREELNLSSVNDKVFNEIILGVGGTCTNDGGAGAAQALGVGLLDPAGVQLPNHPLHLVRLERIVSSSNKKLSQISRATTPKSFDIFYCRYSTYIIKYRMHITLQMI